MAESMEYRIADLVELFDGPHATPTRLSEGPYFLNIASLSSGRLDLSKSDHVSEEDFRKWTKRVTPQVGDLLFSYETRLGQAALMPSNLEACLGRRMALMRPDTDIVEPRFLLYLYLSPTFQRLIEKNTIHGATVTRIALSTMPEWKVELPSLTAQRAIAEVLGALDDKIAANTKLAIGLDSLASAQYEVTRRNAHDVSRLSEIVTTQYGLTTSAHHDAGPKLMRVTDINKKPWVEWGTTPNCTVSETDLKKYHVDEGDILVARMADPGKAAYVDHSHPDAVFASYLVRLKAQEPEMALYVYYFLRSGEYKRYAEGATQGTVQKNMNARVIVATDISLPSESAVAQFAESARFLRNSISAALHENRTLAELRDTLLPELMSGRLRVKDAVTQVGEVV